MANQGNVCVLDDGYTESAYLARWPAELDKAAVYEAVRIRFRPATHRERVAFFEASKNRTETENDQRTVALIVRHVQEWDVRNRRGQIAPINTDTVRALKPMLFDRLFNIVLGYDCGDIDPEASREKLEELDRDAAAAAEEGKSVSDYRAERDEKNL